MASHHSDYARSNASFLLREQQRLDELNNRDLNDDHSESSQGTDQVPGGWPASNAGGSNIGGFDAHRAAARAEGFLGRRASTIASMDRGSSAQGFNPPRTVNGDETPEQLREMIAGMQEQMNAMARELHDGGRGRRPADPAVQQARNQRRLLDARARLDNRRFENEMGQMDREEIRMNRQQDHKDFELAHQLQMQEYKEEEMRAKLDHMQRQEELSKLTQFANLLAKANSDAERLTSR